MLACAASACLLAVGCGTQVSSDSVRPTESSGPSAAAVPAGVQREWLHGVGVDAPAAWKTNDIPCGMPVSNTLVVEYTGSGTEACLHSAVTGLSVIWMGTFERPFQSRETLGEATVPSDSAINDYDDATIDGIPVKETTQRTSDGRLLRLVLFLDRGVYMSVASTEPSIDDAAVNSLQVVTTDPATGCAVHTDEYDHGAPSGQADSSALLPGDPTSAVACTYVSGWLEQTATVTGDKLTALINAVRAAPHTTDQRSPIDANCESVANLRGPSDNPPMLLRFDGPDGSWRLVAQINWCTRWQSAISSESVTRRIDQQLMLALPQVWVTNPDPDSMDIPSG